MPEKWVDFPYFSSILCGSQFGFRAFLKWTCDRERVTMSHLFCWKAGLKFGRVTIFWWQKQKMSQLSFFFAVTLAFVTALVFGVLWHFVTVFVTLSPLKREKTKSGDKTQWQKHMSPLFVTALSPGNLRPAFFGHRTPKKGPCDKCHSLSVTGRPLKKGP